MERIRGGWNNVPEHLNLEDLNAMFDQTHFIVKKEVVYDHQHLFPGDQVIRLEEWRKAPEGHYIARFMTQTGEDIPLLMDEVCLIADPSMYGNSFYEKCGLKRV